MASYVPVAHLGSPEPQGVSVINPILTDVKPKGDVKWQNQDWRTRLKKFKTSSLLYYTALLVLNVK